MLNADSSSPPKGALCLGEDLLGKTGRLGKWDGDGKEKELWSVICDGTDNGHGKYPGEYPHTPHHFKPPKHLRLRYIMYP